MNKSDVIRVAAAGNWLSILAALIPQLKPACDNVGRHVACPVTGGEKGKDGFRLFKDADQTGGGISNIGGAFPDGFSLLMWVTGWTFTETMNEIAQHLNIENWKSADHVAPKKLLVAAKPRCDQRVLDRQRLKLREVWKQSYPINAENARLARKYLYSRSIFLTEDEYTRISKTMRFHPNLEYWHDSKLIGHYPTIISLVNFDDGKPASLHRIYLNEKGLKLNLIVDGESLPAKKLMARCNDRSLSGGAIQLDAQISNSIDLSEGIETGLAVLSVIHKPVWSCVSATLLANFIPPKGVTVLNVWADKDQKKQRGNVGVKAGSLAAKVLKERMRLIGVKVNIYMPKNRIPKGDKSFDWNDVLAVNGKSYFPSNLTH